MKNGMMFFLFFFYVPCFSHSCTFSGTDSFMSSARKWKMCKTFLRKIKGKDQGSNTSKKVDCQRFMAFTWMLDIGGLRCFLVDQISLGEKQLIILSQVLIQELQIFHDLCIYSLFFQSNRFRSITIRAYSFWLH